MLQLLQYGFVQRAVIVSIALAIVAALISVFIILKHMAFAGSGIAHTAFGGVALGLYLGWPVMWTAAIFSLLAANAMALVSRRGKVSPDTAIGIFFSLSMALGVLLVSVTDAYNVDLFSYLFGSLLAITPQDVALALVFGAFALLALILLFRSLLMIAFDPEVAQVCGVAVPALEHFFFSIVALTVVLGAKLVGIILISALLVIPGACASQLTDDYRYMLVISVAVSLTSVCGGLVASYVLDTPPGATIVSLGALFFFLAIAIGRARRLLSTSEHRLPTPTKQPGQHSAPRSPENDRKASTGTTGGSH